MGSWACPACGGENPEGMRFCGHCGAQRETDWQCASCDGTNAAGMRFCGHCGTPREASGQAATAPPAPAQEQTPTAAGAEEADVTEALRSFISGQVADRLVESGGRMTEERRLITALFADVSGFTRLADRLDPEQLLEVIDPVIAGLSSIVGRYEGYVDKFAGDALLALFGAPVTHEDDAERALRVALDMHREVDRLCRELPHDPELTLHVGINSGHAIARILGSEARLDYAVLGDSVILAQRLESQAPPRETYVSEMTMRLTEGRFEFEPIGELTLKGISEPVPAWRLLGERTDAGRQERAGTSPRLVGREAELADLSGAIDQVGGGVGAVVSVVGEAGVGKSRLSAAARAHADERGLGWLEGRCVSYGGALAYWPYVEMLRAFAGVRIDDAAEAASVRLASALDTVGVPEAHGFFARLLGLPSDDASSAATLEPEAFRRGLHVAFAAWLRACARDRATVLAIEDMHWADASTIALTAELASIVHEEPVLFYLLGRLEADTTLSELAPVRTNITLEPLGEAHVEAMIESILGQPAPPELSTFVASRTAGNPFFVEEVLRSLQETAVLVQADGRWSMRPGWDARTLPETVEEVLSARIDQLARPAAGALQVASVIGRRVPVALLEAVGTDIADLPGAVDQLVSSGFLERAAGNGHGQLMFHHALAQDAAYSRILRRRRRDLHRKVADAAEQLYGAGEESVDLLARHLYLGEAGAKARDYLVRAGERARRLFANDEAILHFARAAEVSRAEPELEDSLPGVLLALADLHELVGNYDDALELYTEVRDSTKDIAAWRGIASTLRKRGEYDRSLAAVEDAFRDEALKEADLTPLWLEQAWTLSTAGRFEQAIDVIQAGLEATERKDAPIIARLLHQLARAETVEGRFDDALDHGAQAVAIFEAHEDMRGLSTALRIMGDAYTQSGRLDDAVEALRRGFELAERVGSTEEIGGCLINLGWAEYQRGNIAEAIECDRRAIEEFDRIGHASGRTRAYTNIADKLAHSGELDEALAWCDKALELSRSIGHTLTIADVYDTIAYVTLQRGDFAAAAEKAEEAVSLYLEMGLAPQAAATLGIAAEAWDKAGAEERARDARSRARDLKAAA
jgi:adenylate cyclase